MVAEFEPVDTVEDYYDGPHSGVANDRGRRHRFRSMGWTSPDGPDCLWDRRDNRFKLVPIEGKGRPTVVVHGECRAHQPVVDLPTGTMRPLEVRWSPEAESPRYLTSHCRRLPDLWRFASLDSPGSSPPS